MNKNVPKLRFKEFSDEWEAKELGTLGEFFKGSGISKSDLSEVGRECILYGQLYTTYGEVINKIKSKTNIEIKNPICSKVNDVIMPSSGESAIDIATASCVQKDNVLLGGDLNVFRAKYDNGVFISYQLNNSKRKEIAKIAQGASVVHIYNEQLKKVKVNLPSLEEQEKIADFFTILDSLIEEQEGKVIDLKIYKKGMMQKIFKQEIRFKDDNGLDYPEWEEKRIKDIGVIMSGIGFSEKYQGHKNLDYKIFKVSDMNLIGNEKVMTISNNTISEEIVKQMKASLIEGNSIIFAKVGAAIFLERKRIVKEKFLIDNNMMAINIYNNNNNLYFCYYILNSLRLSKYAQIGALPSYNSSDIGSIKIKIPIFQEQTKIANFLSNIDNIIVEEKKNLDDLREMKKGLLQQMFV